jgi:VanZ family protein
VFKYFFLVAAMLWTGIILFFCLENPNKIPQVEIPLKDKTVHFVFHFLFTYLWFMYFKEKFTTAKIKKITSIIWLISLLFGIAIEFAQQYFTTTRTADITDVLANSLGATIAFFLIIKLYDHTININKT